MYNTLGGPSNDQQAPDPDCCGDGPWNLYAPNNGAFLRDPELRKPYSRHLGGVNLGFLDGHAGWIHSIALINKVAEGDLDGLDSWGPTSDDRSGWGYQCGFPTDEPVLY